MTEWARRGKTKFFMLIGYQVLERRSPEVTRGHRRSIGPWSGGRRQWPGKSFCSGLPGCGTTRRGGAVGLALTGEHSCWARAVPRSLEPGWGTQGNSGPWVSRPEREGIALDRPVCKWKACWGPSPSSSLKNWLVLGAAFSLTVGPP